MENNADHPRLLLSGKSVGPTDTFNIGLPDEEILYISDSEDSVSGGSGCVSPGSNCPSPSGLSAASSTETMAATPTANAAIPSGTPSDTSSTIGPQSRPPSILTDSSLSFSLTWGAGNDTANTDATDASATATAAAAAAAAAAEAEPEPEEAATSDRLAPGEFLFRCPPAVALSKAARVASFCQHPVLASFMYAALAVERFAGDNKDSSFIEYSDLPSRNQALSSSASSGRTSIESWIRLSVEDPSQGRYVEQSEEPSASSVVESSADPQAEGSAKSTLGSSAGSEAGRVVEEEPLEGESSGAKVKEQSDPPRARRGWGLATGLAGVAVGIAISAAFVARRR